MNKSITGQISPATFSRSPGLQQLKTLSKKFLRHFKRDGIQASSACGAPFELIDACNDPEFSGLKRQSKPKNSISLSLPPSLTYLQTNYCCCCSDWLGGGRAGREYFSLPASFSSFLPPFFSWHAVSAAVEMHPGKCSFQSNVYYIVPLPFSFLQPPQKPQDVKGLGNTGGS